MQVAIDSRKKVIGETMSHNAVPVVIVAADGGKATSVIPVLNQCKCIGCSPDKHPDTQTMAIGSDDDSRDSVQHRCLCIAAWPSERLLKYQRRARRRAH